MRIYVAGPWGDFRDEPSKVIDKNIQAADNVGQHLVWMGHEVYVPHTMCRTWTGKFTAEEMERLDNSFLLHWAEALFKIPGRSAGATAETFKAWQHNLIVFAVDEPPHKTYFDTRDGEHQAIWGLLKSLPL